MADPFVTASSTQLVCEGPSQGLLAMSGWRLCRKHRGQASSPARSGWFASGHPSSRLLGAWIDFGGSIYMMDMGLPCSDRR